MDPPMHSKKQPLSVSLQKAPPGATGSLDRVNGCRSDAGSGGLQYTQNRIIEIYI